MSTGTFDSDDLKGLAPRLAGIRVGLELGLEENVPEPAAVYDDPDDRAEFQWGLIGGLRARGKTQSLFGHVVPYDEHAELALHRRVAGVEARWMVYERLGTEDPEGSAA